MNEIADLLEPYIGHPVREGQDMAYRCPFHGGGQEAKPSFYVRADTGTAFCHACDTGWLLPSLLKRLGAPRSLIQAAMAAAQQRRRATEADGVSYLPEELADVYCRTCPAELLDAGFDQDVLRTHEVGFDRTRQCPVYLVRDHLGSLVGMSARLDTGYTYYTPDMVREVCPGSSYTGVKKSLHLWGLHLAYPYLLHGGADRLLLVEGFKACLWCVQHTGDFTVALMGSYLSAAQVRLIEGLVNEVTLMLDNDRAGQRGTVQCVNALARKCRVRVVEYPEGYRQPDDLEAERLVSAVHSARYWR